MKMLCLDIPQPGATMESYQPHMQAEVRHAWRLYKQGFARDISFRQDRPGVAIMVECESVEEAKQTLAEFPLAKAGLIDWEVIPLGPFANLEILFAPQRAEA
jgi:hypothetical protein